MAPVVIMNHSTTFDYVNYSTYVSLKFGESKPSSSLSILHAIAVFKFNIQASV